METIFRTSYIDGASVEIIGDDGFTYDVLFYDNTNNELIDNVGWELYFKKIHNSLVSKNITKDDVIKSILRCFLPIHDMYSFL